ncbi:hypothetical protein AAG570_011490 [Ranatra chinensis]|uniref:ESF1-like protein n=1 Tax=Ranatra chinensis TaxID=642074 RepID=A0ABD0Z943_9HEMI
MKDEEINGPKELTENSSKTVKENCGDAEGSKYHMEKLRQYQLNRLKYYYAVVVCNTAETANKLYLECDGMEYESSATKLDMRFIPDDMFFDQEPKDVCNRMPDLTKYSPRLFANTALQQIKVNLTWDETDPDRIDFNKKVISGEDMPDGNLKEYIATSSEEGNLEECENEVNEDKESICGEDKNLSKYRSLLAAIKDKKEKKEKGDVEMEITWEIGLRDKIDNQVEEKSKSQLTPFERIIQKKKERRRQKREISKAKFFKDNDDLCSDNEIQSDVDLNDPFFNEMHKGKGKKKNVGLKLEETGDDTDQHKFQKELELLLAEDEEEEGKSHFNFKAIQDLENTSKKKRRKLLKKNKQIPTEDNFKIFFFQVNVQDERFSALYNSHLFNIDPADSHYRKTKGMEEFIKEKLKRKIHPDNEMMKVLNRRLECRDSTFFFSSVPLPMGTFYSNIC